MARVRQNGGSSLINFVISDGELKRQDAVILGGGSPMNVLQVYLARKKKNKRRSLRKDYLGSYGDPRGGGCFL